MAIKFVTDSMMDPGAGLRQEYDYEVIPIPITVGEHTYSDGIDISPEMVVDFGLNSENFPKTSQITAHKYKDVFEKYLKNGDDVVYVGLSSGLSGTLDNARKAAEELKEEYPDREIKIIDSKVATLAQAMILQQGLKLNKLGKSIDEIEETLNFLTDHINIFFVVGDLKWLGKGGRVSRSVAALGNLLNIVPILYINDGKIEIFDKVRGKKKATKRLEELLKGALKDNPGQVVGMIESKNPGEINKIKKAIEHSHLTHIMLPDKGPGSALTVHTGDDLYGIGYFDELPENYVNVNP